MFGGYNNIQSLLNNNKNLLRGKKIFKKESSFSDKKKELMGLYGGELEFKKLSNIELKQAKKRIKKKARRENLKSNLLLLLFISLFTTLTMLFYSKYSQYQQKIEKQEELIKEREYKTKFLTKFQFCIKDGDSWLAKGKYRNAIYQYKKALKYFPKNKLAKAKLNYAYSERCKATNVDCDKLNN